MYACWATVDGQTLCTTGLSIGAGLAPARECLGRPSIGAGRVTGAASVVPAICLQAVEHDEEVSALAS